MANFHKKQIVFSQGDLADALFYIQEGKVKLTVISNQGKEAVLALLGAGDFFGEGCLAGQQVRMATASAMSQCSLMKLEKAVVIRVLHDEPAFSERFLSHLLTRKFGLRRIWWTRLQPSEKRWRGALRCQLRQGRQTGAGDSAGRQGTLAEMIGTTRSRVSFFMNRFRKLGFIEYNGGLHVHSSLMNIVLHD
jgi:CRP-like cAMP-binding protein